MIYVISYVIGMVLFLGKFLHRDYIDQGIKLNNLDFIFIAALGWPVTCLILIFMYTLDRLEEIEKRNGGYLLKKPTKAQQFNKDIKEVIK